ncbi:uncharacterized protein LOC130049674 [Ostrea edulis]|uniref:uncharacterized protein LOC130049674 n=1 Tax=Ostrea edulis TaxID=37623 RepID=UPI0024AEC9DD|nr:uncharacterized protein LOC130049674 [Ostrea edulis]
MFVNGFLLAANFSWCASIEELNTSELKKEISCQSYCNWIRTTIDNTIAKENLQSGRSCEFRYKKQLIRNKEHLLERGTFTPWICSISIFDNKEDECTTPEYQYSDDQWNNVAFVVIGIYLMLVNVIVLSVGIHQMTKRLDIEIEQLEIRNQRELFDIACMLMHREIRCLVRQSLGQRSTRYQSIAEDHYELIPIPNDYEAPLQIPSILPGTEYQAVAPYEMRKEGCVCRYCLDQAAKDHPNSFPEIEGAHGTVREYESLEGVTTYLDGATSEKNTIYSLLNRSPDVSLLGSEGKAHLINDHSPSTRRRRSRRRMHRGRKPGFDDYDDGDFDRDLIPLEQIKQRHEDTEDADFISQLLSNVKRESTTDVFPGFSLFKIPETLPNFKRKEENESICLSEFSFLEVDYQEELNDIIDAENTEPEKLNFNTEMLKDDETYKTKEASKDVVRILHTESGVDDKRTRTTTGFCIAEVHFDAGNSEGESNTSDYLQPMSENSKKINSRKNQTHVIEEF